MSPFAFNPFTGSLDVVKDTSGFLKLDQTMPDTTVGTFTFPQIKDSGLTITRVPYASTAGLLIDNAAFTFTTATGLLNTTGLTASGTVQAEHLKTTDDLEVADDILLASGSAFNWNSGDITLTHSADTLTFAGMTTLDLGGGRCTTTITSTSTSGIPYAYYGAVSLSGSSEDTTGFDVIAGNFSATNTFALTGTDVYTYAVINTYGLQNGVTVNAAHTRSVGEEGSASESNIALKNTCIRGSASPATSAIITTTPYSISNYGITNTVANYVKYNNSGGSITNYTYGGHFTVFSAPTLTAGSMSNVNYGFYATIVSTVVGSTTNYGAYISVQGTGNTNRGFFNGSLSASLAHNFLGNDNIETRIGTGSDLSLYHDATNSYIKNITGKLILGSPTTVEIGTGAAGVDYILQFNGETNDGVLTWMEDEDYFKFSDDIFMNDAENIILGTTTGTKIGTATSQKLSFFNSTPVVQQTGVAAQKVNYTAGDLDTEAEIISALNTTNAAINTLRTALNALGLTSTV